MSKRSSSKALSLLLMLAMISCLFFGLTLSASASGGAYTVTFSNSNSAVYVSGTPGALTSATSSATGTLDFMVIPSAGYKVTSVTAAAYGTVTGNCTGYTISDVEGATTVTVSTSAISYSGSWADNRDTGWYTTYSGETSMPIADAADLAAFAYEVNTDTNHEKFDGKIVYLTADIDLSAHEWVPIGGQWDNSNGYPPSGNNYFEGTFDGKDKIISGMYIDIARSGIGLFGNCCKGRIANVTVCGDVAVSTGYAAVGGIVGYTNGSIFNCTSNVNVHCASVSNVGGVAGVVENKCAEGDDADRSLVQYCTNNGNVSSTSTRIGGVIGATYVTYTTQSNEEVISVDRCTNNGPVTTSSSAYKTFIGGIIGYCQSTISNSINTGTINSSSGATGHRMGGVVGILNGWSSIYAKMANCINIGTIINGYPGGTYDGALCYEESGTTLDDSFYIDTPYGYQTQRGTYTDLVMQLTASKLKSELNHYVSGTNYIDYYVNDDVPWDWSGITGDAYTCTTDYYPYITDSVSSSVYREHPEQLPYCDSGCACSCTEPSGVYYDPDYTGGNSDGSYSKPYNNLQTAVTQSASASYTVLPLKSITHTALNSVTSYPTPPAGTTFTFKRSCYYSGYLLELSGTWDATDLDLVIDGNANACPGSSSLISVTGGTITLGEGVTLQNNKAGNNGAAIRMLGGTVNMYGTIKDNSTVANGGGVAVMSDSVANTYGTFNLYGGDINGNSATYGYGGGIYVSGNSTVSGHVNITSGTIGSSTANSAVNGDGVYVKYGTFTISPDAIVSFGSSDVVYLCEDKTITIGNSALSTYVAANSLKVKCEDAGNGRIVATSATSGDQNCFAYDGGGYTIGFDEGDIYLIQ